MTAITNVIDASAAENCNFENFRIDGNKAVFAGTNNILGKSGSYSSSYRNIISHDCQNIGFKSCNNILICYSYSNGSNGFDSCYQVTNCFSYSNGNNGFTLCYQLSACYSYSNTDTGYSNCYQLSNCFSYSNGNNGFNSCYQVTSCSSQTNSRHGFIVCKQLIGCKSISNAVSAYAFTSCWPMQQCTGSGGSAWRSCFADFAGSSATADTAAGGYNFA
jgi:hypothetical protein